MLFRCPIGDIRTDEVNIDLMQVESFCFQYWKARLDNNISTDGFISSQREKKNSQILQFKQTY